LRSLEVAGELLQELSRLGEADEAVVKRQCEEYLDILQVRACCAGFRQPWGILLWAFYC
jgi:hypothetical protein